MEAPTEPMVPKEEEEIELQQIPEEYEEVRN
jgi:hypothetical protein